MHLAHDVSVALGAHIFSRHFRAPVWLVAAFTGDVVRLTLLAERNYPLAGLFTFMAVPAELLGDTNAPLRPLSGFRERMACKAVVKPYLRSHHPGCMAFIALHLRFGW